MRALPTSPLAVGRPFPVVSSEVETCGAHPAAMKRDTAGRSGSAMPRADCAPPHDRSRPNPPVTPDSIRGPASGTHKPGPLTGADATSVEPMPVDVGEGGNLTAPLFARIAGPRSKSGVTWVRGRRFTRYVDRLTALFANADGTPARTARARPMPRPHGSHCGGSKAPCPTLCAPWPAARASSR